MEENKGGKGTVREKKPTGKLFLAEHHSITFSLWAVAAYALPSGVCADLSVGAV